jgi:hypothetical protein
MTKLRLCCISAFLLIATVPWFFTEYSSGNILGFPSWAFYSICVTLVYAIVTAAFFERYWSLFTGDEKE